MLYLLFVVGGMSFYLLLICFTLLCLFCSELDDEPGWTIGAILLFCLLCFIFGDLGRYVSAHPWYFLISIPAYVGIGVLWSFPKWFLLLRRALREYREELSVFLKRAAPTGLADNETRKQWSYKISCLEQKYGFEYSAQDNALTPPTFAHNRVRLINWVALWPWSVVWTLTREIVIHGFERLVDMLGGTYQRLSNWVFRDLTK
jgi:hypothetical protein